MTSLTKKRKRPVHSEPVTVVKRTEDLNPLQNESHISASVSVECTEAAGQSPNEQCNQINHYSNQKITIVLRNTDLRLNRQTRQKGEVSKLADADNTIRQQNDIHSKKQPSQPEILPRPDLVHQCLMMLLDSPLNKSGKLDVLLENIDGKIISVASQFRIPRTWKVFSKVMVDFLTNPKNELCPTGSDIPLLKLLEPPLSKYMHHYPIVSLNPEGIFCRLRDHLHRIVVPNKEDNHIVFFIDFPITTQNNKVNYSVESQIKHQLAISYYPIATSVVCNRLCNELELLMGL